MNGDGTMSKETTTPSSLTDIFIKTIENAALIAAGQLGLFKTLAKRPRSIPEIAHAINASETGVARLVEALASVGYLERVDDRYANGPTARAWLTPASPVDFTPLLLHWAEVWPLLGDLSQVIRRGGPQLSLYQLMQDRPEWGRTFAQFMKARAQLTSGPIVERVVVPDKAQLLLDLGGSHGLHSIAFCRSHPNLKAIVFDLPVALTETEENITAEGLADRVNVQRGDYLTDDIGQGYDVVLCFNLVHHHTEDDNRCLIRKIAKALNPGGLIVIYGMLRDEHITSYNALFSLLMFTYSQTRLYSFKEIIGWLKEVAFSDFNRIDLPPAGQNSIITAVKTNP